MATIPGSHFTASASAISFPGGVNVVETTTGTGLPPAIPTDFNLEVFVGDPANAPPIAPGYQGLAVLTPGGSSIELISGSYTVTDDGETLTAKGDNETVVGGAAFANLILDGNNDVANGGTNGGNYIEVNGTGDTVNAGAGQEVVNVNTAGNTIIGGTGPTTITAFGGDNFIQGGKGGDTITAFGNNNTIIGGANDLINATGTGAEIFASGGDTVNVFSDGDTIGGLGGHETIGAWSNNDLILAGSGSPTILLTGTGDTVVGGGTASIDAWGSNFTFADSGPGFNDTVVGFNHAAGDTIKTPDNPNTVAATATQVGANTVISFSDGSHLTLVGVSANTVNASFFHS